MAKRGSTERRKSPYCTTREAAGTLGVSVRTVQLWAERGMLEAWKTEGGHRRIGIDSLHRFMAGEVRRPRTAEPFKIVVADDDPTLLKLYQLRMRGWESADRGVRRPVTDTTHCCSWGASNPTC